MKQKHKLIYETKDYSKFIKDEFNRAVRPNFRLRESFEKHGWLDAFPMLVVLRDGKMVIKDGQHRFDTAVELKLPIKYVVMEEDGIQACEISSTPMRWSLGDFVASHAQRGNKEYLQLLSFKNETGLPLSTCAGLLYGNSTHAAASTAIKDGCFKVRNERHARSVVSVIHAAATVVKWASNSYFVSAISQVILYGGADVATLCDRIRANRTKLVVHPNVAGFIEMLEEVYNYRNRCPVAIAHNVKLSIAEQQRANGSKLKAK